MTATALLLAPSRGRGGGIERYVETIEWALSAQGVNCCRIDLSAPGTCGHARMLRECRRQFGPGDGPPDRLIVAHRSMVPAAALLTRRWRSSGISVICHGVEVWAARPRMRSAVEDRLMRRSHTRVVAVSNFTSGALFSECQATILPPGLSPTWFATLVEAANAKHHREPGINLMTAFRLADFRNKGLPELLDAIARLGRADVRMTVCGSGQPPEDLRWLISGYPWCTLRNGLSNEELALQFAAADLFVLATRTRRGQGASGEGFGMVLLEAQVAGTPVVGPAFGGSHEAFLHQVTGEAPVDETAEALSAVLDRLLRDPARLEQMGRQAAQWSRQCFAPDTYASRVVSALL
jgi:phosphatidylinositol alpha-1,6-mannosyltransferase